MRVVLFSPDAARLSPLIRLWLRFVKRFKERTVDKLKIFFSPLKSLAFNDEVAETYGQIRADLEKKGTPIGPYDLQIASIAVLNNLILVTHNKREFSRVDGLNIEDWE